MDKWLNDNTEKDFKNPKPTHGSVGQSVAF